MSFQVASQPRVTISHMYGLHSLHDLVFCDSLSVMCFAFLRSSQKHLLSTVPDESPFHIVATTKFFRCGWPIVWIRQQVDQFRFLMPRHAPLV
jgi:hypothetical protein